MPSVRAVNLSFYFVVWGLMFWFRLKKLVGSYLVFKATRRSYLGPKAWRIIEDKLYLSYDPGAAEGLVKNPNKVIDSRKHWSEVEQTLLTEKASINWTKPSP